MFDLMFSLPTISEPLSCTACITLVSGSYPISQAASSTCLCRSWLVHLHALATAVLAPSQHHGHIPIHLVPGTPRFPLANSYTHPNALPSTKHICNLRYVLRDLNLIRKLWSAHSPRPMEAFALPSSKLAARQAPGRRRLTPLSRCRCPCHRCLL